MGLRIWGQCRAFGGGAMALWAGPGGCGRSYEPVGGAWNQWACL